MLDTQELYAFCPLSGHGHQTKRTLGPPTASHQLWGGRGGGLLLIRFFLFAY